MVVKIRSLVLPVLMSLGFVFSSACNAESEQTRLLKQRNAEFNKEIIRVSDRVYTAVGYGVSPVSMIVGAKGLIIVDTGISVESAKAIRADFRKIVDKPVKAIVFTHGHPDHIKGGAAFMDTPDVQVWARTDFGHEQHSLAEAGISIQKRRGAMQAGFLLSAEQRINNGIAKAYWPKRKGGVFAVDKSIAPSHIFDTDRQTITIAGIDLELVAATGETHDQLYVWLPSDRVAFAGDNFYKSWPNLYAIRGTPYRDIRSWANAIDSVLQEQPNAVVGGHTRPILGKKRVKETLTNFRDAIQFLFDKTVEGINKGLTPNQLVEYVQLPKKYRDLDYLRPYYGNPQWAIRAIFGGYLGWFDGNATSLFPLSDKQEAERIVALAGGMEATVKQVDNAMRTEDYQWAAQLCDHILAITPNHQQAMLYKADALTALADKILTATARNYYISSAIQLRKKSQKISLSQEP
ncbi:alkyl/aryl-sulfatase [Pseudomaricurvus alkylphenolicus]|nr:alkyl/aryl-sulfatase [Pseudomaricurvus alkylphenolicus]